MKRLWRIFSLTIDFSNLFREATRRMLHVDVVDTRSIAFYLHSDFEM